MKNKIKEYLGMLGIFFDILVMFTCGAAAIWFLWVFYSSKELEHLQTALLFFICLDLLVKDQNK